MTRLGEDVPEAERLVAGAGDNGLAVGTHGQVEDPVAVAGELGELGHGRILPDEYLILRVAVRGDELVRVLRPGEVAHLRARVHGLQVLPGERVPEPDASVGRAAARRQQARLVRRPRYGLHRRDVIVVRLDGRVTPVHVPHEQFVVVAARRQQQMVRRPLQTTHLLLVTC